MDDKPGKMTTIPLENAAIRIIEDKRDARLGDCHNVVPVPPRMALPLVRANSFKMIHEVNHRETEGTEKLPILFGYPAIESFADASFTSCRSAA